VKVECINVLRDANFFLGTRYATNFWDYRQLNRFRVAWMNVAIFVFPRSTTFYLYYHNLPEITPLLALGETVSGMFPLLGGPLFFLAFLLVPNLVIAGAASRFGFGINFWVTFAFVLSCVCNFEAELEVIRQCTLPPGPLSWQLLQRFNIRGLWSPPMLQKWRRDVVWLSWTVGRKGGR